LLHIYYIYLLYWVKYISIYIITLYKIRKSDVYFVSMCLYLMKIYYMRMDLLLRWTFVSKSQESLWYGNNYCEYLSSCGHESIVIFSHSPNTLFKEICMYIYLDIHIYKTYLYLYNISWKRSLAEDSAVFILQSRSAFAKFYVCIVNVKCFVECVCTIVTEILSNLRYLFYIKYYFDPHVTFSDWK